jgi:serine/threonine protein kinase
MEVVYKARDSHLDRFMAIKILPSEGVADPERKRRFIQEAQSVSALNHPNIITVHDITQEGGMDFMVMEYVPGKTLGELIPINTPRTDVAEPPRTTVISPGKAVLTPLLAIEDLRRRPRRQVLPCRPC